MIPVPRGVRVWLAVGRTDMRKGMNGLALQVQEALGRDPHAGDLYVFRGARGDLIKIVWHDGIGMSLYAKRLEQGRFIWPSPAGRRGRDLGRAARLHAGGDRLAQPAPYLAAECGRMKIKHCTRLAALIQSGVMESTPDDLPDDVATLQGGAGERAPGAPGSGGASDRRRRPWSRI